MGIGFLAGGGGGRPVKSAATFQALTRTATAEDGRFARTSR